MPILYLCVSARTVRDGEHSRPCGSVRFVLDNDNRGAGAPGCVGLDDHDDSSIAVPRLSGLTTWPRSIDGRDGDGDDRDRWPDGRRNGAVDEDCAVLGSRQSHGSKGQESLEQLHGVCFRRVRSFN